MLGLEVYSSGDAPAGSVPGVVSHPLALAVPGIASTQGGPGSSLERDGARAAAVAQSCTKMLRAGLEAGRALGSGSASSTG